jgi:hypothetical protein
MNISSNETFPHFTTIINSQVASAAKTEHRIPIAVQTVVPVNTVVLMVLMFPDVWPQLNPHPHTYRRLKKRQAADIITLSRLFLSIIKKIEINPSQMFQSPSLS